MKQKVLIFHPALAPYRIDFFNALTAEFNTSFYFNHTNVVDQKYNQKLLKSKSLFKSNYLSHGFEFFGRSFRFGIRNIIKTEDPAIIICSEYGPITLIVYLYRKIFKKKYKIYTISDDSMENSIKRRGIRALLRNFFSKNIDGIILPSQEVYDWFKETISNQINILLLPVIHNDQVFREELQKSLNVANDAIFSKNLIGKKIILYVGRLATAKNLFFLLETVVKIKDENYLLIIVGEGHLKSKLEKSAIKLKITEKVIFSGYKEGLALLAWYNSAHIFVLPSTYEPFGAVVNEALLAGCHVLCSKKAGASSLINSSNGQVFDPYNGDELLSYMNEKLKQINTIKIDKVQLRESKMPFTFSSIMDTFLMQLKNENTYNS